jgi:hypothetical protein
MKAMKKADKHATAAKQEAIAAQYDVADINRDGEIDENERILMKAMKKADKHAAAAKQEAPPPAPPTAPSVTTAPQPVRPLEPGMQTVHHTASESNVAIFREFRKFDADGDGYISNREFHDVMGGKMPPGKVDAVFTMINTNGNGKISLDEFKKVYHLLVSVPTLETRNPVITPPQTHVPVEHNASQASQGGAGVYGNSGQNLVQGSQVTRTFHHATAAPSSTAASVDELLRSQWDPEESRRWENARSVGDALDALSPNTRGGRRVYRY